MGARPRAGPGPCGALSQWGRTLGSRPMLDTGTLVSTRSRLHGSFLHSFTSWSTSDSPRAELATLVSSSNVGALAGRARVRR